MARSQKDDPRYNNMQHPTWNYHPDSVDNRAGSAVDELSRRPVQLSSVNEQIFGSASPYTATDVYPNKLPYMNPSVGNGTGNGDPKLLNNKPNMSSPGNMQNYGNAMLNLGNGQLMRVLYDENNQQIMIPVKGQYELFNHNQGVQPAKPSHMFTINQDCSVKNSGCLPPSVTLMQSNNYGNEISNTQPNIPTSSFLNEVWGDWKPSDSGTYSPFGTNYPLKHPNAPLNLVQNPVHHNDASVPQNVTKPDNNSPKRSVSSPLAETAAKKRIVAEVKPMRPSYSDVLAKNAKNNPQPEANRKTSFPNNTETKVTNKSNKSKNDKPTSNNNVKKSNDDKKEKNGIKKLINTTSSSSESGDFNTDEQEKRDKPAKKTKNKENLSRKWSSVEDVTNELSNSTNNNGKSQFMFIEKQQKTKKDKKPSEKSKQFNTDETLTYNDEEDSQFNSQDNQGETKIRKKKESRSYIYKTSKPSQDKKKPQSKWRKNKPGYLGLIQNYLEHWWGVTVKAVIWFFYLVSDILHMSAHLSFDICTSAFTQTYVSSQAVWRSCRDAVKRLPENKYLQFIDNKIGHTWLGFWRKLKWFRKEVPVEIDSENVKLNANIPLPATGDEAMKRLLACKGKDPYSILGVSETCTDEEIKRYYRRQAFLVHPDKNQTPGAEEAFKILQHAFDLIGEPERRGVFDRSALSVRQSAAAWGELSQLLTQLHNKMEYANSTIRCTNCGRRHKRVLTSRPCYAARYCATCNIHHSAKEGDIWAESSYMGLLVMYYACMDGGVYQITQWASCQKKNLGQLRPDCHSVQYRIVLGNKAGQAQPTHDPNLEEFLNNLYNKSGPVPPGPPGDLSDKKKRAKKTKAL